MLEENDWRLMGQERYLMDRVLKKAKYTQVSETWDHDHCRFCTDKFSEFEGHLHEGYCTLNGQVWICAECYEDFKEMFRWTLAEETEA